MVRHKPGDQVVDGWPDLLGFGYTGGTPAAGINPVFGDKPGILLHTFGRTVGNTRNVVVLITDSDAPTIPGGVEGERRWFSNFRHGAAPILEKSGTCTTIFKPVGRKRLRRESALIAK